MNEIITRDTAKEEALKTKIGCLALPEKIITDSGYEAVASMAKDAKNIETEVVRYFADAKKTAHDIHKAVCDEEARYLKPIKAYMDAAKRLMMDYQRRQEEERRRREEEARALARAEAERLMAEAAAKEQKGEDVSAIVEEAVMTEAVGNTITIQAAAKKPEGVSTRKDWKITEVSFAEVPCEICGVTIRPVDESAVMKLIRATKGTIKIPGIKYEEYNTVVVRR